jgi:hypothetical protein
MLLHTFCFLLAEQALLVFNAAWLVAFSCIWASKIGLFEPGSPLTPLVDGFDGYFSSFTGERCADLSSSVTI